MALTSTLYRFRIDLSDIDRGVYETLDFRVAMHPSESADFLLTRVLAYARCYQPGLEFSPGGLSDSDQPALRISGEHGSIELWIEIGSPTARKLHKASKSARTVKVFTYKDPRLLLEEIAAEKVHRADAIEIYSLAPRFLGRLAARLDRDNEWNVVFNEGTVCVTVGDEAETGELTRHA